MKNETLIVMIIGLFSVVGMISLFLNLDITGEPVRRFSNLVPSNKIQPTINKVNTVSSFGEGLPSGEQLTVNKFNNNVNNNLDDAHSLDDKKNPFDEDQHPKLISNCYCYGVVKYHKIINVDKILPNLFEVVRDNDVLALQTNHFNAVTNLLDTV